MHSQGPDWIWLHLVIVQHYALIIQQHKWDFSPRYLQSCTAVSGLWLLLKWKQHNTHLRYERMLIQANSASSISVMNVTVGVARTPNCLRLIPEAAEASIRGQRLLTVSQSDRSHFTSAAIPKHRAPVLCTNTFSFTLVSSPCLIPSSPHLNSP